MRRASKFAAGWNTSVEPAANRLPRRSNPLPGHPKAWLAIAMAWAAAFVDVVGWLVLYHVFTAHMTGNTASFGIDVAERDWTHAFHQSWPLVPFLVGLVYGASTSAAARRLRWHSSFAIALVTELLLLGLFISLGTQYSIDGELRSPSALMFYFLLSLPAAAMGIPNGHRDPGGGFTNLHNLSDRIARKIC